MRLFGPCLLLGLVGVALSLTRVAADTQSLDGLSCLVPDAWAPSKPPDLHMLILCDPDSKATFVVDSRPFGKKVEADKVTEAEQDAVTNQIAEMHQQGYEVSAPKLLQRDDLKLVEITGTSLDKSGKGVTLHRYIAAVSDCVYIITLTEFSFGTGKPLPKEVRTKIIESIGIEPIRKPKLTLPPR